MTASKYPCDGTMLVLVGVWLGSTVVVDGGELRLDVDGRTRKATVPIPPAELDDLEDRGWVELVGDGEGHLRATDRGVYHAKAWAARKLGKGRVRNARALRPGLSTATEGRRC
jgi:hypothetical protein